MAKKPDKREVCEKLFAHRIKQRQGLQRNQWAVDNAVKGAIALCATGPSGSNLTFESEAGFPPDWSHASLAHANRYLHHSQAR